MREQRLTDCMCGCSKVIVTRLDDDDFEEVEVGFYSNYLGNQKSKFKSLLDCLRGKDTCYAGVLLSCEEVIDFFERILNMLREEDE